MMGTLSEAALAIGGSADLSFIAKATFVTASGLAVAAAARRARASRRHLTLAATFGVLLLLPFATAVAPPVVVPVPAAAYLPTVDNVGFSLSTPHGLPAEHQQHLLPAGATIGSRSLSRSAWLRIVWTAGVIVTLLPLFGTTRRLRRIRRTGQQWPAGDVLIAKVARIAGVRRRVSVILQEQVEAPLTYGLWRPVILLPPQAALWSEADLRRAFLHELEHIRRADWPLHLAARATCAFYWFHPMIWLAWRQLCLHAEHACDDAVAERGDRTAYADQLVTLAARLSPGGMRAVLSMAARGELSCRVLAVLDEDRRRGRAGAFTTAAATAAVVVLVAVVSPLTASTAGSPQSPDTIGATDSLPSFDVASVRRSEGEPSLGDGFTPGFAYPGGRWVSRKASLRQMLGAAYPEYRRDERIIGPLWIETERFDIDARAEGNPSNEQIRLMVRRLLAERFKLESHIESREIDAYVLVRDREDGSLGPNLRPPAECQAVDGTHGVFAAAPPKAGELPSCGLIRTMEDGVTRLSAAGAPFSTLIYSIQMALIDRPVLDRTNLTGTYGFDLEYDLRSTIVSVPSNSAIPTASGPSLVAALREQLGLRLEARKEMLDVLVIDHVEMPTPN